MNRARSAIASVSDAGNGADRKPRSLWGPAWAALLLVVSGAGAVRAAEEAPRVVVDRAGFSDRLPAKVYVRFDAESAEAEMRLRAVVGSLRASQAQVFALPEQAIPAAPVKRVAPVYPVELRREGVQGVARYLLLVDGDGQVAAVYCYQRSHSLFERSGALALARWTFTPARIGDAAVATLVDQPLSFALAR